MIPAYGGRFCACAARAWLVHPTQDVSARSRRGSQIGARPQNTAARCGLLCGRGGCFAFLPTLWVLAALVAWGIFVWPGVAQVHREFQNAPEGEPSGL